MIAVSAPAASEISDPFPDVAASYVQYLNGDLLWAHKPDRALPPASLTKIMTALIVIERLRLGDVVTISRNAERETGTRLKLQAGEKWYVGDLLAGALINSANDACHALAEHIGGTEKGFVKLMNKRALQLGLINTRFKNACGHDADPRSVGRQPADG